MAEWVLIKGWHDSGSIEAVYGPYSEARARWLWDAFLADNSMNNWTLTELQNFTEPPADPPAGPKPVRDPASTTAARTDLAPPRRRTPTGFGTD